MAWLGVLGGDGLTVSRRFAVYSLLYKSSRGYQVDGLPRASHNMRTGNKFNPAVSDKCMTSARENLNFSGSVH